MSGPLVVLGVGPPAVVPCMLLASSRWVLRRHCSTAASCCFHYILHFPKVDGSWWEGGRVAGRVVGCCGGDDARCSPLTWPCLLPLALEWRAGHLRTEWGLGASLWHPGGHTGVCQRGRCRSSGVWHREGVIDCAMLCGLRQLAASVVGGGSRDAQAWTALPPARPSSSSSPTPTSPPSPPPSPPQPPSPPPPPPSTRDTITVGTSVHYLQVISADILYYVI